MQTNQKNPGTGQTPEKNFPQPQRESDNRGKEGNIGTNKEKEHLGKNAGNEDTKKGDKFQK
ncbi:MAG TPA: hypothetical protein VNE41_00920 [Chitinophagaceae bacterium]|nr:hypothetical protein [Chitinophagaceae bacterium]